MSSGRGRFISLEGGEGAGKSTVIEHARNWLERQGVSVLLTREPGGTALGEELRQMLLAPRAGGMETDTELLLMYAARAEHVRRVIAPALAAGRWVLSDRFNDATFAYQGGGRGIDVERIRVLDAWVLQGFGPDLTLLLDLPVTLGLERARARGAADRFEQEKLDFFDRVRAAYRSRADADPGRFRLLDASLPLERVLQSLESALQECLGMS
jgi:dTMP kinase